jgi:hypothetical protein
MRLLGSRRRLHPCPDQDYTKAFLPLQRFREPETSFSRQKRGFVGGYRGTLVLDKIWRLRETNGGLKHDFSLFIAALVLVKRILSKLSSALVLITSKENIKGNIDKNESLLTK